MRHLATAAVGVLSLGLAYALPPRWLGWAGWVFALLGPIHGVLGRRFGLRRQALAGSRRS